MLSIILEAGRGAGKSTLAKLLAKKLGWDVYLEPASAEDGEINPYLQDYLKDPKRWAMEMQMYLLGRRSFLARAAHEKMVRTGRPYIMDRSAFGDTCFAEVNREIGNIDERGMAAYEYLRDGILKDFTQIPTFSIFLDCDINILLERSGIRGRAGEEVYQGNRDYFERLNKKLASLKGKLANAGSYVISLDWNTSYNFKNEADQDRAVTRVLEELHGYKRFLIGWEGFKHQVPGYGAEYKEPMFDTSIFQSTPTPYG